MRTPQHYLRLESLDTDILPDPEAVKRTQLAASTDADNSYLPFIGQRQLREVAAAHISRISGVDYSGERNTVISAGGLSGIINVLLATIEVGDEVIVTDPTYAGLINRVRLAGGIPKFVPFCFTPGGEWALDRDALRAALGPKTRAMLLMSPSMPSGGWLETVGLGTCQHVVREQRPASHSRYGHGAIGVRRSPRHSSGRISRHGERTITVGSSSKELRMIGWRVGWIVAPEAYIPDLVAVSLANVVVPVGIAQDGGDCS